jgi:hypothetical protein
LAVFANLVTIFIVKAIAISSMVLKVVTIKIGISLMASKVLRTTIAISEMVSTIESLNSSYKCNNNKSLSGLSNGTTLAFYYYCNYNSY